MMVVCRRRLLAVISMLLLVGPGWAQTVTPPEQTLYQDALQSIAEGRKNDASEALMRVIEQEPLHAGAWLDLALIQCSLGRADEAERLFAAIETRFKPPQGILDLIAQARKQGCNRWQARNQASISLGRGNDQNVNQGASNPFYTVRNASGEFELPVLADFLPKHDQYSVVSGEYIGDLTANGSVGFAQFQARRNDRLHDFDSASLFLGIDTPWRFGDWTLRGTGMVGLVTLGGTLYQRQMQVQARVGPPIPLPSSAQFELMLGLNHVDYVALTNFNSNTLEARGQFTYRKEYGWTSASLGFLDDRASDQRPGGNRHGMLATIKGQKRVTETVSAELGYTRQTWRSQSAYLPGLISEVRNQTSHVLLGTFVYSIDKDQSLQLELRKVRNRENISIFQYNNRQIQLTWKWKGL